MKNNRANVDFRNSAQQEVRALFHGDIHLRTSSSFITHEQLRTQSISLSQLSLYAMLQGAMPSEAKSHRQHSSCPCSISAT
jgi:hypothetical protein